LEYGIKKGKRWLHPATDHANTERCCVTAFILYEIEGILYEPLILRAAVGTGNIMILWNTPKVFKSRKKYFEYHYPRQWKMIEYSRKDLEIRTKNPGWYML
jgi:hypothetical protein